MNWKNQHAVRHAEKIKSLVDSVLEGPGETSPQMRRAAEGRAASHAGRLPDREADLPQELVEYIDKVALHAYKVTDEDIESLRKTGYSEDAIFELTLSAALGAGIARLERGITSLRGTRNET